MSAALESDLVGGFPMNDRTSTPLQTVVLPPSYALPVGLAIAAVGLFLIKPWLSLPVMIFALFLIWQTATLRLHFTDAALEIYRSDNLIRSFPYSEWQNWKVFWPTLPILLYFKEVKSIHFVPILFSPQLLQQCLMERCPRLAVTPNLPPTA
jgi:hypothetical protein